MDPEISWTREDIGLVSRGPAGPIDLSVVANEPDVTGDAPNKGMLSRATSTPSICSTPNGRLSLTSRPKADPPRTSSNSPKVGSHLVRRHRAPTISRPVKSGLTADETTCTTLVVWFGP